MRNILLEKFHLELKDFPLLKGSEIAKYQILLRCPDWSVTLGCFDVNYATEGLAKYVSYQIQAHMRSVFVNGKIGKM